MIEFFIKNETRGRAGLDRGVGGGRTANGGASVERFTRAERE